MKFEFNKNQINEIGLFRTALGIYLLYYQCILFKDFSTYFGPGSMIIPELLTLKFSILFWVWNSLVLKILFLIMMGLTLIFMLGVINLWMFIGLFILQISFHQANPVIISEPQQLANLFLLMFFFIFPNTYPTFLTLKNYPSTGLMTKEDKQIINILIVFLGLYYLLAGLKQLPDPLWRKGEALYYILKWPIMSKDNFIVQELLKHAFILKALNYGVLVFEISFIFLVYSRFRWILIVLGLGYHLGIYMTLDVGSFSQIMLVWYMLLLDEQTRNKFRNLLNKNALLKTV